MLTLDHTVSFNLLIAVSILYLNYLEYLVEDNVACVKTDIPLYHWKS